MTKNVEINGKDVTLVIGDDSREIGQAQTHNRIVGIAVDSQKHPVHVFVHKNEFIREVDLRTISKWLKENGYRDIKVGSDLP